MHESGDIANRDALLEALQKTAESTGKDYIKTIQAIEPEMKGQGTTWLQGIVDQTMDGVMALLPSLNGGQ